MASFLLFTSAPFTRCSFTRQQPKASISLLSSINVRCCSSSDGIGITSDDQTIVRRSGNYTPPNWNHHFVKSLNTELSSSCIERLNELKGRVMLLLDESNNSSDNLELIATLQRLGIAYHFEDKIATILTDTYNAKYGHNNIQVSDQDLSSTALEFRLLREYGFEVPQEVFHTFKDEHGNFNDSIYQDIKGVLSLYEASFLVEEGENILEDAKHFTTKFLKKYITENKGHEYYLMLANHALELPLHWRMPRLEARWFIDAYQNADNINLLLLEFAKLDFNNVQAVHQKDLKHVSEWWESTGLGSQLSFIRDRIVISFYWTVGIGFQPDLSYFREITAKVIQLITLVDDIYNVYGTLDELEQFTAVIERWDACATDHLPNYMKMCFLAIHNLVNEMGYHILKQQGVLIIPHLKQMWIDLSKSYLVEAKWYYSKYTPTLQEYLDNAWLSVGGSQMILYGYYAITNPITEKNIKYLKSYPNIARWGAMLLRLIDDLGTHSDEMKRDDNPKSIQCYMHETGVSKSEASEHIYYLINEVWKKMNKDQRIAKFIFSHIFVDIAMNVGRMAQCMYQYGDGHGFEETKTKDSLQLLLVKGIPYTYVE